MEKAYDVKVLIERLKAKGIDRAEELVRDFYVEFKGWAKESAVLSKNPYDDVMAKFYDDLDPIILPQIDKINGVQDLGE